MMDKLTVTLQESPDGDRLYLVADGQDVRIISRELVVGRGLSHWRERHLCTVSVSQWQAVARLLPAAQDGAVPVPVREAG